MIGFRYYLGVRKNESHRIYYFDNNDNFVCIESHNCCMVTDRYKKTLLLRIQTEKR